MSTVLAMTKLRNQIRRIDPSLVVALRNVRVNESLRGCTGFVTSPTGVVVYVNTEHHGVPGRALYRTAENTRDYVGGLNRYASHDDLAQAVVDLVHTRGAR